ncbi:family 43 glycosylhydrolase [Maribellus sp. CM-23]|uniref:glycoside hydrolase family 43 protein n=1 Tax=Maribellus sp. CM-23 TaxID=2781026 RepID=UPI001F177213|nr:glycoside hydrolase family 43 protein [Maribellus sp. CM-23]MCE4565900.1 family 43 glycosylhydrolase [Maribellus sp. CM-23]
MRIKLLKYMKLTLMCFALQIILFFMFTNVAFAQPIKTADKTLKTEEIRVRDPFILADKSTQTYYLYASVHNRTQDESEGQGVEVYTSKDLQNWTRPQIVFKVPNDFWASRAVWAPEVHSYKGKYYLFTTFTSSDTLENQSLLFSEDWPQRYKRGSQILVSDLPIGPFEPFSNKPHTRPDWMTLDGTLWVEDDQPYMVYCHEWVQIENGTMDLVALETDLSATKGDNFVLFNASDATWVKAVKYGAGFVTDGCFLYKTKTGNLLMIWSSMGADGYAIGIAASESGSIKGPWKHQGKCLFKNNGGHGMIFTTFDGELVIALHQPNTSPDERMQLYKLKDTGESLELDGTLF